jgi:hypothetical protein
MSAVTQDLAFIFRVPIRNNVIKKIVKALKKKGVNNSSEILSMHPFRQNVLMV